jgi:hypothetical protein
LVDFWADMGFYEKSLGLSGLDQIIVLKQFNAVDANGGACFDKEFLWTRNWFLSR